MALSQHAYSRIAKKMQAPMPGQMPGQMPGSHAPWSPPALSALIARIDAALGMRRAS